MAKWRDDVIYFDVVHNNIYNYVHPQQSFSSKFEGLRQDLKYKGDGKTQNQTIFNHAWKTKPMSPLAAGYETWCHPWKREHEIWYWSSLVPFY